MRPAIAEEWQCLRTEDGELWLVDHGFNDDVEGAMDGAAVLLAMSTAWLSEGSDSLLKLFQAAASAYEVR